MRLNINRVIHIPGTNIVVGGLVIIVRRPSIERVGFDNWIKIVPPQYFINDGRQLKGIGREWFTPYTPYGKR
jgi:hypothetical protein